MGFYGNITNTNKTQFTFDRSYSSRALMDQRIDRDGIYLGRYVLVEYSLDTSKDMYYLAFKKDDKFYAAADFDPRTELKYTDNPYAITTKVTSENNSTVYVTTGQVIRTREDVTDDGIADEILSDVFYKCTGGDGNGIALFEELVASNDHYTANYGIDKALYKTENYNQGRGYDSTVWQKVYVGEDEKYVMIAELNTVTPTFELSVDAPTMEPITPHFGTDSTNLNYKLHWQPQWGLRVAAETDTNKSDEQVVHINYPYDKEKNTFTEERLTVPGAIYFNKAGFDKYNRVYHKPEDPNKPDNYLKIQPVKSGALYNSHDGSLEQVKKEDIYEMSVHLPAFGNTMSDLWDALIGQDRLADATKDINSISWLKKRLEEQILAIKSLIGGDKSNSVIMTSDTGVINGGLINGGEFNRIYDIYAAPLWTESSDKKNIFAKDAWIHADFNDKEVEVQVPETNEDGTIKKDENGSIIYKTDENGNIIKEKIVQSEIVLYHNYTPFWESKTEINRQTGYTEIESFESLSITPSGETISVTYSTNELIPTKNTLDPTNVLQLYTPYVDKAGHVVGHNIETITLPHPGQLIASDEKWIHQEMDDDKNLLTISHIQQDIESVAYGDDVESFYVLSNENIEKKEEENAIQTKDNHITKVIKVQKDDFSLYWKGLTD